MPIQVNSREKLINWCKRSLGWPVIDLNLDDDQIEDRIDEALQYFQLYHYDATQKFYISHLVSDTDVANKYIDLSQISGVGSTIAGSPLVNGAGTLFSTELSASQSIRVGDETVTISSITDNTHLTASTNFSATQNSVPITNMTDSRSIIGVTRALPIGSSATVNMFDLRYQMRLHDLFDFTTTSYVNFVLTQQHLRMLEMMFTGEMPIRYSMHQNRVYIDTKWGSGIKSGDFIIVECLKVINPEVFTDIYDDRMLKKYATALLKKQWGANLSKFGGVVLLGGVTLNGIQIYQDAIKEIEELEIEIESKFSLPPMFLVG